MGIDHDTAEFAVHSIRRWWLEMGRPMYRGAKRLLITADCGGSNGNRTRLWWVQLQRLAEPVLDNLGAFFDDLRRDDGGYDIRPCILHGDLWSGNIAAALGSGRAPKEAAEYLDRHVVNQTWWTQSMP